MHKKTTTAFVSHIYMRYFISVSQSCLTLCNPMNHSMPGLPVHHQLPEFTQTHVHRVSDAIQPSYPLLSPSPPALNVSKHQGLFKWVSTSHQLAKVLEFLLEVQIFFNSRFFQLQFSVLRGQIHLCGGVCPMPIGCLKHPWPPWILAQYDRQIFLQALFSIPLETRLLLLE